MLDDNLRFALNRYLSSSLIVEALHLLLNFAQPRSQFLHIQLAIRGFFINDMQLLFFLGQISLLFFVDTECVFLSSDLVPLSTHLLILSFQLGNLSFVISNFTQKNTIISLLIQKFMH